jgi:ectoine hydroxylase-related dioxygenase (phytanoyl-CoA dioxygenase family)
MISDKQVEQFKRDGYLIVRNVFSSAELEHLRAKAESVRDWVNEHLPRGTRLWHSKHPNRTDIPDELRPLCTWGVNELPRKELFDPDLVNVFAHPGVNQAMHALLGPEPRAWGIKLLWNPRADAYDLGWHRDQVARPLYDYVQFKPDEQDHVQFNASLNYDESFLVVPGSHRRALTQAEWDELNREGAHNGPLPDETVADLTPGDIVFMDAHTLHRGRCNTDCNRLTLHYSAQAQWVPLRPWGGEEHFAWLTSDQFIDQLDPDARPFYLRLRTAHRCDDSMQFIVDCAVEHGLNIDQYRQAQEQRRKRKRPA